MPRTGQLNDPMILEAALEGLNLQRQRIDEHIAEVQALLGKGRPGRLTKAAATAKPAKKKRTVGAAVRKRMAEAQKKRRAEQTKAIDAEATESAEMATPAMKSAKKKRKLSAAARKRMAEGAKRGWAARKKAQGSSAKKS